MVIMKFGGTSVKDAPMIKKVGKIITDQAKQGSVIVVSSALKGTTDDILEASEISAKGKNTKKNFTYIYTRHLEVWKQLTQQDTLPQCIEDTFTELQELLHGIKLIKECTSRTNDLILSFGERFSCQLIAEYLTQQNKASKKPQPHLNASYIDSRKYIITDDSYGDAHVNFTITNKNIKQLLKKISGIPIVTGFIGSTKEGVTTTLGRNGSDYSASIIGAALNAKQVEIWTDVDGILSADPRIVPDSFVIQNISYAEAMELSFYGAKVIHPLAIVPAVKKNIPILIKNTHNSTAKGTWIRNISYKSNAFPITGLTSITKSNLLTIEGAGLSGNFYFLPRIFNVFAQNHVQPLMITQASSEHSICFVFEESSIHLIKNKLLLEFKMELASGRIQDISTIKNISIISIIGSNMRGSIGLAGKVFATLQKDSTNIIAIAQGSNETNISVVVEREKEKYVLKTLHKEFFTNKIKYKK